jgi:hypothetical protein
MIFIEYEPSNNISSKKNQQRLDNSYLKIKIKIINNMTGNNLTPISNQILEQESSSSLPTSPKISKPFLQSNLITKCIFLF